MQLTEIATGAGIALFGLAAILVALFAAYWLKQKVGVERLALIAGYAQQAVLQVEQLWHSGQIQKDSRYITAVEYLRSKFPGLTEEEIDTFVEAALGEMNMELGKWRQPTPAVLPE